MRFAVLPAMAGGVLLAGLAAAQSDIVSFAPRADIPIPALAAGSTILVALTMDQTAGDVSCTDSDDNAYTVESDLRSGTDLRTVICAAYNVAALEAGDEIRVVHPSTANARNMIVHSVTGLLPEPLDQKAGATGSSTTPSSGNTAMTTQANEVLYGVIGHLGVTSDFTVGAGFTPIGAVDSGVETNRATEVEYRIGAATGQYAATGILDPSRDWAASILALKCAGGAAAPGGCDASVSVVGANNGVGETDPSSLSVTLGASPWAVITGDFNGDKKADLATPNYDSDNVSVLLGNGNGTFTSAGPFAADIGPAAIQTGDLDGDGKADLVVANDIAGTVSVLLGNGDGSFQAAQNYQVGTSADSGPVGVAIGRFNADDYPDIATANYFDGDGTVSILLGKGDGTFEPGKTFDVAGGPWGIAAGRIDAGTNVDLAVSVSDAGAVVILLGNGDGTFGAGTAYEVGLTPEGVVLQDLDGDSDADIAVVNNESDSVSVLLGNGEGAFAAAVDYRVGGFPEAVAVGDFNGDRVPDLVSADNFGAGEFFNSVSVLLGNGDGTFGSGGTCDDDNLQINNIGGYAAGTTTINIDAADGSVTGAIVPCDTLTIGGAVYTVTTGQQASGNAFTGVVITPGLEAHAANNDVVTRTPASAQCFEVNASPFGVTGGDFNGDHQDDIVSANFDSGDVSLLLNEARPCAADCNGDKFVKINELIIGVNIALGSAQLTSCASFDTSYNNKVEINELIKGVKNALDGCPA